jgi:hypothetical protein
MKKQSLNRLKKSDGGALIEFAIIVPFLFLLVLGVIEYGRAIHTKNIITHMSREGANLAARTQKDPQTIMSALATTADPLDIETNGMIFITEVMGIDDGGTVKPIVHKQYRYVNGGYSVNSKVWGGCGSWSDEGECQVPGNPVADLEGDGAETYSGTEEIIKDGETVCAVEVFYDYAPITNYAMKNNLEIYSSNIF